MTENDLIYANDLRRRIRVLENFILDVKSNRNVRILNRVVKKNDKDRLGVIISDYMRPYVYYELTKEQREKMIKMLEEDLRNYKAELEDM